MLFYAMYFDKIYMTQPGSNLGYLIFPNFCAQIYRLDNS